jgi:outer membrane protein assembly factor BamB
MKAASSAVAAFLLMAGFAFGEGIPDDKSPGWPQWRGPLATGVAPDANPPVEWGEGKNIRWKVPIPGRGLSSPIVWKDRIFLTTAIETREEVGEGKVRAVQAETPAFHRSRARMPEKVLQFVVMALRRNDGSVIWKRTVCQAAPHSATHADGSWASGSPITDGERVYAYFGSYGLYALDMEGELRWSKQLGLLKMKANFGEGTSPVLSGDLLILSQDQEGPSFIAAFDRKTGEERWKRTRDENTSWSTPLIVEVGDHRQVITSASKRIRSYDPASGTLLWEAAGMTGNVVPSPVAHAGIVYCMSGFRGSSLMAIRLAQAKGDVNSTPQAIAWSAKRNTPYVPSPLLCEGLLYYGRANAGALTCADAATGKVHYGSQRLEGIRTLYASPVAAAGRVYVTGREGLTFVVEHGPEFKVLARNQLDDRFSASAAVIGEELFLRGEERLYCVSGIPMD